MAQPHKNARILLLHLLVKIMVALVMLAILALFLLQQLFQLI